MFLSCFRQRQAVRAGPLARVPVIAYATDQHIRLMIGLPGFVGQQFRRPKSEKADAPGDEAGGEEQPVPEDGDSRPVAAPEVNHGTVVLATHLKPQALGSREPVRSAANHGRALEIID